MSLPGCQSGYPIVGEMTMRLWRPRCTDGRRVCCRGSIALQAVCCSGTAVVQRALVFSFDVTGCMLRCMPMTISGSPLDSGCQSLFLYYHAFGAANWLMSTRAKARLLHDFPKRAALF